jgi:LacI family transcriptional regulator
MTPSVQKRPRSVVSIRTIAGATGLSLNTVSLALQGSGRVKPNTRERIVAAARELGYQPNLLARAVITGRSQLLGVLIPGHDFSYMPRLLEAIQNEAVAADYGLLILSYVRIGEGREIRHLLEYFLQRRVEGMMVLPPTPPLPAETWEPLRSTPTVWLGVGGSRRIGTSLALQPSEAGRIAAERLVAQGCRRLAYGGPAADFFSQHRWEGVAKAAARLNAKRPLSWAVPDSVEGGAMAAEQWLRLPPARRPQGFIGFTDAVAVGFLHRLLVKGCRIPDQVAVVGVDDTPLAAAAAVPLSTVRAPAELMGRLAVKALIGGEVSSRTRHEAASWEWVERSSTCKRP